MLTIKHINSAKAYYFNDKPLALLKDNVFTIKHKIKLRNIDTKLALKLAYLVQVNCIDKAINHIYSYSQDYSFEYYLLGQWIPSLVLFDSRL